MTDKEKIAELVAALFTIKAALGITNEFCPLGVALQVEPVIRRALKAAGEEMYKPHAGTRSF